jgi:YjbE family integral membrane protein
MIVSIEQFIAAVLNIVLIDIVLSGDNAIVIGMAVRNLPPALRNRAIVFGTVGAVVLRIILTALATVVLQIPLVQAGGGLLLVWITYRLIAPESEGEAAGPSADSFSSAFRTIILADVSMSLDNVLAVGAAAHGEITLLLFGLSLSLVIIMAGGRLVSALLNRLSWLIYIGAAILLILAGEMIAKDALLIQWWGHTDWLPWLISLVLAIVVLAALRLPRLGVKRET